MPRSGGLLMESDDSDVPDLDLPIASHRNNKSKLFSNPRSMHDGMPGEGGCVFSVRCALVSLMVSLVVAVAFLGFLSVHLMSQMKQLQRLLLLPQELEIVKRDIYRLKTDFDLLRISTSSSSSDSAWNATSFVSERLDTIESEVKAIATEVKDHMGGTTVIEAINALSTRMDTLEDQCARGCGSAGNSTLPPGNRSRSRLRDRGKRKRSKGMFTRDSPIVFTRAKD